MQDVFHPMEEKTLKIGYQTYDTIPIFESIVLELIGIPAESIKNRAKSDKSSADSVEYYKFDIVTCPQSLHVQVQPAYYKFPLHVFVGALNTKQFQLINNSPSDVSYKVKNRFASPGVITGCRSDGQGVILKQSTKQIDIDFTINTLDYTHKKAEYIV